MKGEPWVLVAGVGQVGTFAARALCEAGCRVTAVDREPAPGFFARFGPRGSADIEAGDLSDPAIVRRLFAKGRFDAVVAAAGLVGSRCEEEPELAFRANVEAPEILARTALQTGVKRFIFLSSLAVYGRPAAAGPIPVGAPCRPVSAYGRTKAAAEDRLEALRTHGLDLRILRSCGLYGPLRLGRGSSSARRIEELLLRATRGTPLHLRGPENCAEEYLYVKDAAQAIKRAVLTDLSDRTAPPIFNLGWGRVISIRELADAVRLVVPGLEVQLELTQADEQAARAPLEISDTIRRLGFEPGWPLVEGLRDYLSEAGFAT